MKVLHILDERWDSALTAYGLSLAAAQQRAGMDVAIAARPGLFAFERAKENAIRVVPLSGPAALRAHVLREAVDVVNAHTGAGHAWGWLAVLGRPAVLVRTRGEARGVRRNLFHAPIYRRTDAVIAASRALAQQYAGAFPEIEPKLRVVYPGVAAGEFVPEPAGPARIALLGRLDPVKGQKVFLSAIDSIQGELGDEEFLISGEEKNTPSAELERFAAERGLGKWVRFSGRHGDVAAFMRSCHAGVVASLGSEALSRAAMEWMAAGRPVAASAVGCLPELVSTGENGFLVPPNCPDALGKVLLKLVRDADLRRALGKKAHETAVERYGLDRFARETAAVYEEALRARRPS